jgi:hypothetical protein
MLDFSTFTRSSAVRASALLASGLALILAGGCSDDGLAKRYAVSGQVTVKGAPVKSGSISFIPAGGQTGENRGASGAINDGYYSLSTLGDDDGAFPGDYLVTVSGRAPDLSKAADNAKSGGSYRQDDVAKAFANAKSEVPLKYESPEAGGLKAKVEAKSQTINFDLKD